MRAKMIENNRGKIMLPTIIMAVIAVMIMLGTTIAFFNYTRTGGANNVGTGRISFNAEQGNTVTLSDLFPINVNGEVTSSTPGVGSLAIHVTGDTEYTGGIEYLVKAVNVTDTNGTALPISISIDYEASAGNNKTIGTPDNNYFTNRGGSTSRYKVLSKDTISEGQDLVVGYIAPGDTGIDGNIIIMAYLDARNIAITDTLENGNIAVDGYTNGTTNTGDGNWVNGRTVMTTSEWNALQANGVSFQIKVEAREGTWVEKPISPDALIFEIKKNVITPTNPINFANISSSTNGQGLYILPGTENDTNPIYYYRGNVNNNNVIFGDFCWQIVRTTDTGGIKMIYNGTKSYYGECENTSHDDRIIGNGKFNSQRTNMENFGYMKNASYISYSSTSAPASGVYFGTSIEYGDFDNNRISEYRLVSGSRSTTLDANHHYSCDSTNETGTCETIKYYFFKTGTTYYYVNLNGGEKIEDLLYKITGNGDAETKARNTNYVLNQNDSTIKTTIESWFRTNLTDEENSSKKDYTSFLEDTIFCNDRSYKNYGLSGTLLKSGFNPNGGKLNENLFLGSYNRFNNDWYSTSNVPSVTCPNETDRFMVSNNNAKLKYPVGLLNVDEVIMAGIAGNSISHGTNDNQHYYLYTGGNYWLMSPIYILSPYSLTVSNNGAINYLVTDLNYGIRPVISLKYGVEFEEGGDGTPTNPYVVKYDY